MHDVYHVSGLGLSCTSKQFFIFLFYFLFLSLFLLILLGKLMNQKKGNCRDLNLYPLRLEPLFPNDDNTGRSRADLRPSNGNA